MKITHKPVTRTVMDIIVAPSHVNIFIHHLKSKLIKDYPMKAKLYRGFIDDIFIWLHAENELHKFISYQNSARPTIKFTKEHSDQKVTFLDSVVHKTKGTLSVCLYTKPTNTHVYLDYQSAHPFDLKNGQILRLRRNCTDVFDYLKLEADLTRHYKINTNVIQTPY